MMSRYKLGLATATAQHNADRSQHFARWAANVGATKADWALSDYHNAANDAWAFAPKQNGTAGVAIANKNGPIQLHQYQSSKEASDAYDAAVNKPGSAWYIALFDDVLQKPGESAMRDETYLGGVNETTTQTVVVKKEQPVWPWVVGFLGIGGVYMASSKKKRGGL